MEGAFLIFHYLKEEIERGIEEADRKVFSSMPIEDLKPEGRRLDWVTPVKRNSTRTTSPD